MIKMEIVNGKYSNRAYYKLMRDLKRLRSVVQTIAVSLSWAGSTLYVFAGGSVALFTLLLSCSHLLPAPRVSPAGRHRHSVDGSALLRVPSAPGYRRLDLL